MNPTDRLWLLEMGAFLLVVFPTVILLTFAIMRHLRTTSNRDSGGVATSEAAEIAERLDRVYAAERVRLAAEAIGAADRLSATRVEMVKQSTQMVDHDPFGVVTESVLGFADGTVLTLSGVDQAALTLLHPATRPYLVAVTPNPRGVTLSFRSRIGAVNVPVLRLRATALPSADLQ